MLCNASMNYGIIRSTACMYTYNILKAEPVLCISKNRLRNFWKVINWSNEWYFQPNLKYLHIGIAHNSLNFLLELAMQLQKYIWILQEVQWMKCMSNLTDRFVLGIINIYTNYCVLLAVTRSTNILVCLAVMAGKPKTLKTVYQQ